MGEQGQQNGSVNNSPPPSSSESSTEPSFTTTDFIDKIKETILLATEIQRHPQSKSNDKIQNLLKLQCSNALRLLSTLNQNQRNPLAKEFDFGRPNFSDNEKFALLSDINDSIIDKTILYTDQVKNIQEGKQDLIEVHAKVSSQFSRIELRDFRNKFTTSANTPNSGNKRKFENTPASHRTPDGFPSKRVTFLASSNVPRPQTVYRMKVDNSYSTPFIPRITRKPNSRTSLEESIAPVPYANSANVSNTKEDGAGGFIGPTHFYPHPYQKEIEEFEASMEFLDRIDEEKIGEPPKVDNLKPIQLIQSKEQLKTMVEKLKNYSEITVDVEHHSFRTYQGITSLIQISTDDDDYIIDVFPLWNEMELLNEVFTSPSILKIFHGADYDIVWLQRDLGIYVVNMFDTGIAAKMLNYSHVSLSYLVSKFCDFQLDKRFQLADWRIRPIPEEMLNYARYDTYFLLYIYRRLKQELLAKGDESANLLRVVMDKSRDLCLKRYEKKLIEPNDHFTLIWKNNLKFNNRQLLALKSLYTWRDCIARNEDESTGYVLPNNLLLKICEILPREQQGILACCNPIPPLVRQYINEIHKVILDARSKQITNATNEIDSKTLTGHSRKDLTIDLSNDHLIDDSGTVGLKSRDISVTHDDDDGLQQQEIVPLLVWSESGGKFELTKEMDKMELDEDDDQKKNATSIADMFISNLSGYIEKDVLLRQKKNKVDQLFEGYVSPFQRYLKTIEQKKQEQTVETPNGKIRN